jgi:hypothetical protein
LDLLDRRHRSTIELSAQRWTLSDPLGLAGVLLAAAAGGPLGPAVVQ